jgi:glutamate synthase (NADPH/NADH) small chain
MGSIAETRSENAFADFKPAMDRKQAIAEAQRCLYCYDAPCIRACPTTINIPEFIRKIATDNVKGAARTILTSNVLGMSCSRVCPVEVLCAGDCVYNATGEPPIQIGRLQRYATDQALAKGWRFAQAGPDSGRTVALVGAGPASLACAHELRRFGHRCVVYEKNTVVGGLNATGVAPYKLRADAAEQEVEWLLGIGGIELRTGVEVGRDVSWDEIGSADAVFLGLGLGPDRRLPGSDLAGIEGAVAWIERMKLGTVDLSGVTDAVVIGGGNTAVDCVRELKGLGVRRVILAYRGPESRMSGYFHEWKSARIDGVWARFESTPVGFVGDGAVSAVRLATPDGVVADLPAQLVLLAIGQAKLGDTLVKLGIDVCDGVPVLSADGATSRPGWYAGGDLANGGKEVVNAVAEGRDAARAIHAHLSR